MIGECYLIHWPLFATYKFIWLEMFKKGQAQNIDIFYCRWWFGSPVNLMKTLSFYMSLDYLSLKILYVFGLIQSWNPKFRKQLCWLLCLTILLSRSRCEFNFVYIFYCYRAYLCKLLGLDKYVHHQPTPRGKIEIKINWKIKIHNLTIQPNSTWLLVLV